MKADFNPIMKTSIKEIVVTVLLLGLVAAMSLGGMQLANLVHLPVKAQAYIGGALLAYVVIVGFIIMHNCVKFMLKKGE
jgi:hypothetical protein